MQAVKVTSVTELVTQLGGPKAASKVLGTTPQNVVNWKAKGKIPARLHIVHRQRLASHNVRADDTCWGFVS
jgi:hypothetical protein